MNKGFFYAFSFSCNVCATFLFFILKIISSAAATFFSASSDRGGSADVGRRIAEELLWESDDRIIHRATYESIDLQTGKVNGSFDVDSVLVRINGEWLWDDIPMVY